MILLLLTALGVCQAGVDLFNNSDRVSSCRFALFKTPSSREAAAEVCSSYQKQRGVLAEIQSDEENEEVVTLLAYLKDQQKAWIGLSYAKKEWRWDTGSELSFSKLSGTGVWNVTFSNDPLALQSGLAQFYSTGGNDISLTLSGLDTYITTQGHWNISAFKELLPFVCRMNGDYMAFTTPVTRNAAKRECQAVGMTLASVKKQKEIKEVKRIIKSKDLSHLFNWFWLGGRDAIAQGDWLWEDNSAAGIGSRRSLRWDYGVTTPREGPLYLAFNKITGRVRALHEQFKNPYVCQCPEPQEPEEPQMQSDYGSINSYGKYVPLFRKNLQKNRARVDTGFQSVKTAILSYKYINKVVTHGEAERYCQGMGGHLACPRNTLQQHLIKDTIRGNAWLGVVDVDEEQVYTCIGEEGRALTYTNWYQRFGIWAVPEPDNMTDRMKPGASYVQILYDSLRSWRHGKWIDRGSPQYEFVVKSAFVCEIKDNN